MATLVDIKNRRIAIEGGQYQYVIKLLDSCLAFSKSFKYIDEQIPDITNIVEVFYSYRVLAWYYKSEISGIKKFITSICDHIIFNYNKLSKDDINTKNNFQSHRIKIISAGGYILNITKYIDWAENMLIKQIKENIKPDGSVIDFELRNSVSYVTYDLLPLLETCLNLVRCNRKLYYFYEDPITHSSIRDAVHWLIPYIQKKKINKMFINTIYVSDKQKQDCGKIWDPSDGLNVINMAMRFDKSLLGIYSF